MFCLQDSTAYCTFQPSACELASVLNLIVIPPVIEVYASVVGGLYLSNVAINFVLFLSPSYNSTASPSPRSRLVKIKLTIDSQFGIIS